MDEIQIIAFYEFKDLSKIGELTSIKAQLKAALAATGARGTIILSEEGYNGMVCGTQEQINDLIPPIEHVLDTQLSFRSSIHDTAPFRKIDVKIKPEIVTLKQPVDLGLGVGTHVAAREWDQIISDPGTLVLDARNDYEYQTGTFHRAINPGVAKFSELPAFVANNLNPKVHTRVAMFCTGGIRCEKFAPYLKQIGFEEVYQLEGGILRYLEESHPSETLWEGECFVFDERITVGADLRKGGLSDLSQRRANVNGNGEQPMK